MAWVVRHYTNDGVDYWGPYASSTEAVRNQAELESLMPYEYFDVAQVDYENTTGSDG